MYIYVFEQLLRHFDIYLYIYIYVYLQMHVCFHETVKPKLMSFASLGHVICLFDTSFQCSSEQRVCAQFCSSHHFSDPPNNSKLASAYTFSHRWHVPLITLFKVHSSLNLLFAVYRHVCLLSANHVATRSTTG